MEQARRSKKEKPQMPSHKKTPLQSNLEGSINTCLLISDPIRIEIISILLDANDIGTTVVDLVELMEKSQPHVSYHLAKLLHGKIVTYRKVGRTNRYTVISEGLRKLHDSVGTVLAGLNQ